MKALKYLYILVFVIIALSSCRKNDIITDPGAKLKFSQDSVVFDTIFSTIASITKSFMVYNTYDEIINISTISLANGSASEYRMNVNGRQDVRMSDVEILPNDSIFVFVEITIDPVNGNLPMVVDDSIVFVTNGNVQDVNLLAWGQDVNLYNNTTIGSETWTSGKPYLIYNGLRLDEEDTLTIEKGTMIYFHNRSHLEIWGTLIVNGTLDEQVVYQGDRLESYYDDVPGQWNAIALMSNNHHVINYAEIKNAVVGIQMGYYLDSELKPELTITNSIIRNMSFSGLYCFGAKIFAANTVIGDCGTWSVSIFRGGSYEFYHCTIANEWYNQFSNRTDPSIVLTNFFENDTGLLITQDLEKALFANSIIYGSQSTEIAYVGINDKYSGLPDISMNFLFDNSIIRVDPEDESVDLSDDTHFTNITNLSKFTFKDDEIEYQLDTLSEAEDIGSMQYINNFPLLEFDRLGVSRKTDAGPDLGAYEREE